MFLYFRAAATLVLFDVGMMYDPKSKIVKAPGTYPLEVSMVFMDQSV